MVLAIGARVSPVIGADSLDVADGWAESFSTAVDIPLTALSEPTLQLVHILLLKVGECSPQLQHHINLLGMKTDMSKPGCVR